MARSVFHRGFSNPELPELIHQPLGRRSTQLRDGAYQVRLNLEPPGQFSASYEGTLRILYEGQRRLRGSGDLYSRPGSQTWTEWANETPTSLKLPVFARKLYRYYLRLRSIEIDQDLRMSWQAFRFSSGSLGWFDEGAIETIFFSLRRPGGHLEKSLEGIVVDGGQTVGTIQLRWLAPHVRELNLEVDAQAQLPHPGEGTEWQDFFALANWRASHVPGTFSPSPATSRALARRNDVWKVSLLQTQMSQSRQNVNLDTEWHYYLLCVGELAEATWGLMFDRDGTDSLDYREGAVVVANGRSRASILGEFANRPLVSEPRLYFRTAAHEVTHAMGVLAHLETGSTVMAGTHTLARALFPHFPERVTVTLSERTKLLLRHMPDPLTRPGGLKGSEVWEILPDGRFSASDSRTGADRGSHGLSLEIGSLQDSIPLGAPLRIFLELKNKGPNSQLGPSSLSFKTGLVRGLVRNPNGESRTFSTIIRDFVATEPRLLASQEILRGNMTLFRGPDGPLMPEAGRYRIEVMFRWSSETSTHRVVGATEFTVTDAEDADHERLAAALLEPPNVLLALALRLEEPPDGIKAIQSTLNHAILGPHWRVVEIKKNLQSEDFGDAASNLGKDTVLTSRETRRIAEGFSDDPQLKANAERYEAEAVVKGLKNQLKKQEPHVDQEDQDAVNELERLIGKALGGLDQS